MATDSKVGHLYPTTWAQQAQLAADGKMDEIKELQDKFNKRFKIYISLDILSRLFFCY